MRKWLIVVEATALPLLILTGVMAVTGYSSVSQNAARASIVFTKSLAVRIHTSRIVTGLFVGLLLVHSYAGVKIMEARIKNRTARNLLEYSTLAFLTYVGWVMVHGV